MPRLFIGMPVMNGARFVREAIESLRGQTFRDWSLVVSDNASTDATLQICHEIAAHDPRIEIVQQPSNIGATANFRYVLDRAHAEFFMWAAADDHWGPQFLAKCVQALDASPSLGMAFTGLRNIDATGRVVRNYPDLATLAGPAGPQTVTRYLLSREICGKANLIYSVYRLHLCRLVAQQVGFADCWGADMAFVLGAIARGGISIEPEVLFEKRFNASEADRNQDLLPPSKGGIFPLEHFAGYKASLLSAVSGTGFSTLTSAIMDYRFYRERLSRFLARAYPR